MRSDLIFEASQISSKKYILLRFNPDAYTAENGEEFRSYFKQKSGANPYVSLSCHAHAYDRP